MSWIYLASPYSHPDPEVRHLRFVAATLAAAKLMQAGEVVFCPIAHSHEIGKVLGQPTDHEFWLRQDLPLLACANTLMVLRLNGWRESRGVTAEISFAEERGIPVLHMDP